MNLTIDFETRSKVDLRKVGHWAYAEDPTTEVLMLAVKEDDDPAQLWLCDEWVNKLPEGHDLPLIRQPAVVEKVTRAELIEAHNMGFEIAMWFHVLVRRFQWPRLPLHKLRCSAAKAAMHSLPRSLDGVAKALDLPSKKDDEGHRLMLQMCKPRKPSKNNPAVWWEDPDRILRLCRYCLQDVEAERGVSKRLDPLPPKEQEIWKLDQIINARGICCDVDSAKHVIRAVDLHKEELLGRMEDLTQGKVQTTKQVAKLKNWLEEKGYPLPDVQKATVRDTLASGVDNPEVREVLEIRQSLSKTSTAKYQAMVDRAGLDNRIRGTLLYHGAGTGRWSGMGIQPQNLPRGQFKDVDGCLDLFRAGDYETLEMLYTPLMTAASTCIRGMLIAADGKILYCADYASIEGIVLAWIAGEIKALEVYKAGKAYETAASWIFNVDVGTVAKDSQERQVGKVAELALGYQGGVNAFKTMAPNYGVVVSDEEAERIKTAWRKNRPKTVKFWYAIEQAATAAVEKPGSVFACGPVKFGVRNNFLICKLPSGRLLYYYGPHMGDVQAPWGDPKRSIRYYGVDSYTRQWKKLHTYGGKLTENVTQAVARDIMAEGMLRIEKAKYPLVLSVHDELLCEVDEGFGSLEEFTTLMSVTPPWAEGCPVRAEGWKGKRYRK